MKLNEFENLMAEACDKLTAAQDENKRLRAAIVQFVAACDTAPPISLITELGRACDAARLALMPSAVGDVPK